MLRSFLNLIKISFSLSFWWWVNFHWKHYLTFKGFPYLAVVRYFSLACMKQVTLETEVNFPHRKNYYFSYTSTKTKLRSPKACDYHLESNLNLCVINIEIDGHCKTDNRFRNKKQQQQQKKTHTDGKQNQDEKRKGCFSFYQSGWVLFFLMFDKELSITSLLKYWGRSLSQFSSLCLWESS